jgi:predicted ribosome quality control (RQC) complex YloA/Tae2 family protein
MLMEVIYLKNINKNITFCIGKNAQDNFDIIDASLPEDMWFHVKDLPSCHVVAKIPEGTDRKEMRSIIKRGALLCKMHSKYKASDKLEIIYTRIKNIQKTDTPGSVITSSISSISI